MVANLVGYRGWTSDVSLDDSFAGVAQGSVELRQGDQLWLTRSMSSIRMSWVWLRER